MSEISKPSNLSLTWASGGDILDPGDTKYASGWAVEIPPRQWFNYLDNRQDEAIAHINQRGIAQWDALTEYQGVKSYVQGSNGAVYRSKQTNTNQDPVTDIAETYWEQAFADTGDSYTKVESDNLYLAKANNLSDLTNTTTARTNLNVYSQSQTYTKTEVDSQSINSARIDVASSATVNLTGLAPNTRNINITGTTAITSFTVAAGKTYFVRFDAALTLTNSASLITQTGSNIRTAAGDTCIVRATAANVVEVMVFTDATVQSLSANGYRKFKDGMIVQWGVSTNTGTITTVTFPIAFPTAARTISITTVANDLTVAGNHYSAAFNAVTTTSFAWGSVNNTGVVTTAPSTLIMRWIAIGD